MMKKEREVTKEPILREPDNKDTLDVIVRKK